MTIPPRYIPPHIAKALSDMGIDIKPVPAPTERPAGPSSTWRGCYYPTGEIPH